jgi:two-component system, NarL family, response regulator NreC
MCVRVFLADDAAVMRKAIRSLLSNREDIAVVGEASDFRETIQKSSELHPDLILLDLSMADRNHVTLTQARSLLSGAKVLAMTLGTDDRTRELLDSVGAVKLLDKMELANELIPAILELAPAVAHGATSSGNGASRLQSRPLRSVSGDPKACEL